VEKAFEQVTAQQITALKVRTGMQRMDSTQIASNIVSASRLQLLVESLNRLERILSAADKDRLADQLAPFTRDSAGYYTYRIKGKQAVSKHMQHIGATIYEILKELSSTGQPSFPGKQITSARSVQSHLYDDWFSYNEYYQENSAP
jgi:hypothetical protein